MKLFVDSYEFIVDWNRVHLPTRTFWSISKSKTQPKKQNLLHLTSSLWQCVFRLSSLTGVVARVSQVHSVPVYNKFVRIYKQLHLIW